MFICSVDREMLKSNYTINETYLPGISGLDVSVRISDDGASIS